MKKKEEEKNVRSLLSRALTERPVATVSATRPRYRAFPPIAKFGGESAEKWPRQAAFNETELSILDSVHDRLMLRFAETVDTSAVHGKPQVPGHANWGKREPLKQSTHTYRRYSALLQKLMHTQRYAARLNLQRKAVAKRRRAAAAVAATAAAAAVRAAADDDELGLAYGLELEATAT